MPKLWFSKNVKITLVAALVLILILATPVTMTTMVYAAYASVDPVGSGSNPSDNPSDSNNNSSPPSDDNKKQSSPPPDVICQSVECQQPPTKESKKGTSDESCILDPSQDKCKPDKDGNCPPGFSHNSKDQCFPTHKCPPGFVREDNDESGACKKLPSNVHLALK